MAKGVSVGRVLALDLGGTNLRVAAVSEAGELTQRRSIPTQAEDGPTGVADRMAELLEAVAAAGGLGADAPAGVAVPGPIEPRTGVVSVTPNLPGWQDFPLGDALARLGRPIRFGNDGNCAALGEARFGVGAGAGARDLVYLALGTGVGGGVIADGRLIEGANGLGGELGHVVVALDGPRCTCGRVGCLEAFVGGWAIARDAALVAGTVDGAAIARAAADGPITASAVGVAAAEGDPAARAVLDRAGRALGAAIGGFVNTFNPALVVLGGGITAALGEGLVAPARRAVAEYAFPAQRAAMRLVTSNLGDDTALYGAAALAFGATG